MEYYWPECQKGTVGEVTTLKEDQQSGPLLFLVLLFLLLLLLHPLQSVRQANK